MLINQVQDHLEAIYGIRCEHRADAFVVGAEAAQALGGTGRAREELLVQEEDGELRLALYLDAGLLERLRAFETLPVRQLLEAELSSYCELAEGVSHFLYVIHTAEQERTVSLLELEAQAEVDKFATCVLYGWDQRAPSWARELLARLFDRVSYAQTLSPEERWRYGEANRLARNYCRRLVSLVAMGHLDRLLAELRHTYRLGAEAKLRHLAHTE